jgi:hypothetical protein
MELGRITAIAGTAVLAGGLTFGLVNPGLARASAISASAGSVRSVQCTVYGRSVTLGSPSTVSGHAANCRLVIGSSARGSTLTIRAPGRQQATYRLVKFAPALRPSGQLPVKTSGPTTVSMTTRHGYVYISFGGRDHYAFAQMLPKALGIVLRVSGPGVKTVGYTLALSR